MTQIEIISALQLDSKNYLVKPYAAKLLFLFKLINELEKLDGFKCELIGERGNVELVNELPELVRDNYRNFDQYREAQRQQDNCKNIYGLFEQWQKVFVSHSTGKYCFPFPMNNSLYNVFLGLSGVCVQETKKDAVIVNTIAIDSSILKAFGTAVKFISKDDLRPAMQHVLIDCENYRIEVVSTDAHKLFRSEGKECSQKERVKLLVSEKTAKAISKMKPVNDETEIHILEGDKIMIEGQTFDLFTDANFPDYRVVVPEYENYMEFEKDSFIKNVKQVLPYANKSTGQVNFHLNGSIGLHTEDIDFGFESDRDMPYVSKNFADTDIAFNGDFLVTSLSIFKDKTVKMYHNSKSTHAGIFTNDKDMVLLMPLML